MIIDCHTHAFADDIAPRAVAAIEAHAPTGYHAAGDGTLTDLRASMTRADIDAAVILPVATKATQLPTINAWAVQHHNPTDGLIFFGAVHPDDSDWDITVDALCHAGLPGVKLHPEFQQFHLDDEEMIPLYLTLADAGLVVMLHMGDDLFTACDNRATPAMLVRVLEAVPHLRVIAAHGGGFQQWDDVIDCLAGHPRVWIDCAYLPGYIPEKTWRMLCEKHGTHRILFGSDYPWMAQDIPRAFITDSFFTLDEQEQILYKNTAELLSLSLTQRSASCV